MYLESSEGSEIQKLKESQRGKVRPEADNSEGGHPNWSPSGPRFVLRMPRSWTLLLCHHPQNGGTVVQRRDFPKARESESPALLCCL